MPKPNNFYVYVYIDPRNYEELYYGKGKGSRKEAHLSDDSDNQKAKRIRAIQKAGLEPIIRVVAKKLSEHDALLVEKTLLWKLGKQLTNVSSGHYSDNFRPHDTLHLDLTGYDYQTGIYYYNIGDGPKRSWEDYKNLGFISGGGSEPQWREAMRAFNERDVVAAYLKRHGFVGIGIIKERAKPIREIIIKGKPLLSYKLYAPNAAKHAESNELCEYVALVDWVASVDRKQAKWKSKAGIYTTTHVRASLDKQPKTVAFLEQEFGLNIRKLMI